MHDDGRQAIRLDGFSFAQRKGGQKMEMKKVNEALLVIKREKTLYYSHLYAR